MKIISGGQTGVDRAALDVAILLNIPHGGWCPKGRRAEKGQIIPKKYQLKETTSSQFEERTKCNIETADATLILVNSMADAMGDGTLLTIQHAEKLEKPYLIVELKDKKALLLAKKWLESYSPSVLNIAGSRASTAVGIYDNSKTFLLKLLKSYL